MSGKPVVRVAVGTAHGTQGLAGCFVYSTVTKVWRPVYEGDSWHFLFPDPGTKLTVASISNLLDVEIANRTTVELIVDTRLLDGTELTETMGHGRRRHLAGGSTVTVTA